MLSIPRYDLGSMRQSTQSVSTPTEMANSGARRICNLLFYWSGRTGLSKRTLWCCEGCASWGWPNPARASGGTSWAAFPPAHRCRWTPSPWRRTAGARALRRSAWCCWHAAITPPRPRDCPPRSTIHPARLSWRWSASANDLCAVPLTSSGPYCQPTINHRITTSPPCRLIWIESINISLSSILIICSFKWKFIQILSVLPVSLLW